MAKFTKKQRVEVVSGDHEGKVGTIELFNDTLFLHTLYFVQFDDGTVADISEPRLMAAESKATS